MQQQSAFSGTGVALITPFTKEGSIDFPALGRSIDHVIEGGVDFIVSLGTTGETLTLSDYECRKVLEYSLERTADRCPIVAGHFGSSNTSELVRRLKAMDSSGLAGIMSSSPAYSKPSQEGIYQHFLQVAEASPLPLIIYNVPGRTSSNISAETILRLAETSPQFAAVKEASGLIGQAIDILKYCPPNFSLLSGDDLTALPTIAVGGHGSISVIANAYPQQWSDLVSAALQGNLSLARQLNFELWDLHSLLYAEGNPVGIKAVMAQMGIIQNVLRLPLVTMSEAGQKELVTQMKRIISASKVR